VAQNDHQNAPTAGSATYNAKSGYKQYLSDKWNQILPKVPNLPRL